MVTKNHTSANFVVVLKKQGIIGSLINEPTSKHCANFFLTPDRSDVFKDKLLALILYPESYRSEAFNLTSKANSKASAEYLIGILELANEKQLNRLIEEIDEFTQDIISLSINP